MTEIATPMHDDALARRNVYVLVAAQAIMGAQLPMFFTIAGLAGQMLSPNKCWATLPITMLVVGSMLTATPLSAFMQKHGRRAGFVVGAMGGMLGTAIGAAGLYTGSFGLFLLGSMLIGVYMSAQGFFRFAAADTASPAFRPKAISWVTAGGLFSALVGWQLVTLTSEATVVPFLATFVVMALSNIVGVFLFGLLDIPKPPAPLADAPVGRSRMELLRTPRIAVAIICAAVSYALMNLVMTSSPLAIVGCGFHLVDASHVVTAHVFAMYLPSFFTGSIIARFGAERVVGAGLVILTLAGAVALSGIALEHFFLALVLLGVGWNFGFIGATTMLTGTYAPEERGRIQGLNDLIVFGGVSLASISSGGLMNCSGGSVQTGWNMVNIAMLPFLVLAGAALIWLALQPKETRAG